jgi:hypothetical protein
VVCPPSQKRTLPAAQANALFGAVDSRPHFCTTGRCPRPRRQPATRKAPRNFRLQPLAPAGLYGVAGPDRAHDPLAQVRARGGYLLGIETPTTEVRHHHRRFTATEW